MQKIRVGVLMGGKSIEREVSFNSGRTVCDHLDVTRYDIVPIFQAANGLLYQLPWRFMHRGKISDFEDRLIADTQSITWDSLKQRIDFMYICTHGQYAEDGALQGALELLQIPYLGSKLYASALCMDKIAQKDVMRMQGIAVPRDVTVYPYMINQWALYQAIITHSLHKQSISFPCMVKPHKEGSSLGVHVVHNEEELYAALFASSWVNQRKQQPVLIEEKIDGMEFSCIVLTDYKNNCLLPLPPTEVVPEEGAGFFDYEQKYMPGRAHKFTPARVAYEVIIRIQETCMHVMQALDMRTIARIDGFVTCDNRVVIVDPNTLSGMAPSSFLFREAAEIGMSHTDVINHLIETELYQQGLHNHVEQFTYRQSTKKESLMRTRVAVLLGGRSSEREISLESGRNVVYKLQPHTYEAIPIFVHETLKLYRIPHNILVRNSTAEIAAQVTADMCIAWSDLPSIADFIFIGLHGGEGENGVIQGMLETLGMPYNGSSVLTSALCMDKYKTTQLLAAKGFAVPASYFVHKTDWEENAEQCITAITQKIAYPVIVKPHDDGCSVMVQKARTDDQLCTAIDVLFNHGKEYALIEEFVVGMELTVGAIGNDNPQALPPSRTVSTADILTMQEKFLPGAGENQTPAPLPTQAIAFVQEVIGRVYTAVGCKGYARIDCFYQSAEQSPTQQERLVIIEINTLPGLTPATCIFHQAAEIGIKPMEFIDQIVKLGFEEHATAPLEQRQLVQNVCQKKEI